MERHRPPAQGARGWGALENDVRYRAEVRSRTEEVVTFPALQDPMRDLACKGSYSRQRWLSVGIALMARPRLMLLDEPSLDTSPTVGAETFATIRDPARHRDMRVLVLVVVVVVVAERTHGHHNRRVHLRSGSITLEETGRQAGRRTQWRDLF